MSEKKYWRQSNLNFKFVGYAIKVGDKYIISEGKGFAPKLFGSIRQAIDYNKIGKVVEFWEKVNEV